MEDFGYQKDNDEKQNSNINRQIFLGVATIISLSLFVYITITAYHFVYQNDDNVELIKASQVPIRISSEENDENKNDPQAKIDRNIYEDIFGNKKEAGKIDNTKVIQTPETALPPKKEIEKISENKSPTLNANNSNPANANQPSLNPANPSPINPSPITQNNNNIANNNPINKNNQPIVIGQNLTNQNNLGNQASSNDEILSNPNSNNKLSAEFDNDLKPQGQAENSQRKKYIRVQIAAMSSKELAEDQWKRLLRTHPNLFVNLRSAIQKVDLGKRGIFYRLQIGEFFNQIEAENFCQKYISQAQKTRADCIVVE
ncbi:MAG: SPOR domain-containing protein [Alphaproteobacteria bacterium]